MRVKRGHIMKLNNHSLSFRWINCQCFEFKLPNGKTIITDPCYDYPENPEDRIADIFRLRGFHTEDLEACDYVILNHTHSDHMVNLEDVIRRFQPIVICHSGVAAEIAEVYGDILPLTSIYAVDYNGRYEFDGFVLHTYHGMHKPQRMMWDGCMSKADGISQQEKLKRLHTLGSLFNMNFIIDLDNGFRMAFVGGLDDGMAHILEDKRPNIAFRNKLTNGMDVDVVSDDWVSFMTEAHAQIVVPMHFEVWENMDPGFSEKTFIEANRKAEEKGLTARVAPVKRTEWYEITLSMQSR